MITQQVSCELGVSRTKESLLGVIMFVCMAVSTILAVPIAKIFGARMVVLASLYISIAGSYTHKAYEHMVPTFSTVECY